MVSLHALALSHADLVRAPPPSWEGRENRSVRTGPGRHDGRSFAATLRRMTGKAHVRLTADGRNALNDILCSLDLRKDDEVLLPAYTCKVLENVVRAHGRPVFVDVDQDAVMSLSDAKSKLTRRTKALVLVHPYGIPADARGFSRVCQDAGIPLIEDLAQSLGGTAGSDGRLAPLGSFGDYAFCSFRFSKDISCFTGGAVLSDSPVPVSPGTSDSGFADARVPSSFAIRAKLSALLAVQRHAAVLAQKAFMRLSSAHARQAFVRNAATLSDYQAGLLDLQAARLPSVIAARRKNAAYLRKHLAPALVPASAAARQNTFYRFPIRTPHAYALQRHLLSHGIAAERMYDYALDPLPGAQDAASRTLCIPVHHRLRLSELVAVAQCVNAFFEKTPVADVE